MSAQTLLWTPHAKERPQTVTRNGRVMTFTPKRTREVEAMLASQWIGQPVAGPIGVSLFLHDDRVEVTVIETPQCEARKLRRGDIDNYCKLILDALNTHAWLDDRQIERLHVVKM